MCSCAGIATYVDACSYTPLSMRMQVKLVGSTISCEAYHESGDIHKPLRQNPHVQSYIVSTDQVEGTAATYKPLA